MKAAGKKIKVAKPIKEKKIKVVKEKKRKELKPIGFVIGNTNIYISNNDGKLIVVDLSNGKVNFIEKIGGDTISEPFIVNQNLYLIKSGSIVRYN